MTDGETVGPSCHVLDPLHLVVYLSRSLSPWYHKIPDIDVTGKLLAVKVCSRFDSVKLNITTQTPCQIKRRRAEANDSSFSKTSCNNVKWMKQRCRRIYR